jgi:hypothetical protein
LVGACHWYVGGLFAVWAQMIELSTRQNFPHWLALGAFWRGLARSASGDTAGGIPWIEQGIRGYRATGTVLELPFYLTQNVSARTRLSRLAHKRARGLYW